VESNTKKSFPSMRFLSAIIILLTGG